MKKQLGYSPFFHKANSYGITCKAANKHFPTREKCSFIDSGGDSGGWWWRAMEVWGGGEGRILF